jgi:hypothetical protein
MHRAESHAPVRIDGWKRPIAAEVLALLYIAIVAEVAMCAIGLTDLRDSPFMRALANFTRHYHRGIETGNRFAERDLCGRERSVSDVWLGVSSESNHLRSVVPLWTPFRSGILLSQQPMTGPSTGRFHNWTR